MLSEVGQLICSEWRELEQRFPQIEVSTRIVMPDHIHFILFVKEYSNKSLGAIVGNFKGHCTTELHRLMPSRAMQMFEEGFHDRIVHRANMLPTLRNYILDNPRRYMIKKLRPEFFTNKGRIIIESNELVNESVGWSGANRMVEYFGNFLLLKNPDKLAIRVSRSAAPELIKTLKFEARKVIKNGGVLISPWISPGEKEIYNMAIEAGGNIIKIIYSGFSERWKPAGVDFELCACGRMAFIAATPYTTSEPPLMKLRAEYMNNLARILASSDRYRLTF